MNNISIIIPAYNCAETLPKTLDSLISQTDERFSVVLIDDCSSMGLLPIAQKYKNNGLDINYHRNPINVGCGESRMVGLELSTGEYVSFLDGDDILLPNAIELFHKNILEHKDVDMFHSYFYEKNGDKLLLRKYGANWCHGKLFKKSTFQKYSIRFDKSIKLNDDVVLTAQFMELGKVSIIDRPVHIWMDNPKSITRKKEMADWIYKNGPDDFIHSLYLAYKNIVKYKDGNFVCLQGTFNNHIKEIYPRITNTNEYNWLKSLL